MASISKRVRKDGSVAWQVQIRIEGRASVSKTFDLKEEAELFCEMAEKKAAVLSGKSPRHKASVFYQTPFREVIPLYLASPENKGQHTTSITVLRQWMGVISVVRRLRAVGSEVLDVEPHARECALERFLELESGVIRRYEYFLRHWSCPGCPPAKALA